MSADLESYWDDVRVPPLPQPELPESDDLALLMVRETLMAKEPFWLGAMEDEHTEAKHVGRVEVIPQATDQPDAVLFDATFAELTHCVTIRYFALWVCPEGGDPLLVSCDRGPVTVGVGDTMRLRYTLTMSF